ncbi:MAG: ABC transporter substrate-binding protein [Rudaea sp.]
MSPKLLLNNWLATLAVLLLLLAGCSPSGVPASAEIKIGSINPLTGSLAAQGTAVNEGIQYAVDEANAQGGVRGHKITLVARDDESKPEKAIAAAEELSNVENVVALTGGYVDNLVGPIASTAEKDKVAYVATASLDERLTQGSKRYFFRISSLESYVASMTGIVLDVVKPSGLAILYSDSPGSTQLANRQKERLDAAGVKTVVFESFASGLSDFAPLLARINNSGVDMIILDGFFVDHVTIMRQIGEQKVHLKAFLGAFNMEFPTIIKQLGAASEGMLGTVSWEPGITLPGTEQASQAYIDGFTNKFKHAPVPLSMHGYAGARTILAAIDAVLASGGQLTRDAVRDAIARTDLTLPLEHIQFRPNGDPVNYPRVIIQIQNGKHVVVYPKEWSKGEFIPFARQ